MPTALQGLTNPTLAYNLNGITDFSAQMPFLNLMKSARPFFGNTDGQFGGFTYDELQSGGYLDANGYPTTVPPGVIEIQTIWDWDGQGTNTTGQAGAAASRAGIYVLEWDGTGTLNVDGNVNILSRDDNRIVFDNPTGGAFSMTIRDIDPNGTGDHVRNMSIVREDHLELYEAGGIFNPEWTALIDDSRQFRFMDWMETNNSQIAEMSELNTMDSALWGGHGMVPLPVMVRLANELGVDPWFSIPLSASDDFVRDFATYVRDNLDPNLVATFELSNEAWNFFFDQTHELSARAAADWGNTLHGFPDQFSAYGRAAVGMATILDDVYATRPDSLHKTLGIFTGDPATADIVLEAPSWRDADPAGYIAPHSMFDSIAATTYFGGTVVLEDAIRLELINQLSTSYDAAVNWLTEQLRDPSFAGSVPHVLQTLRDLDARADAFGLDLIIYEGGQHVHHLAGVPGDTTALVDFFIDYARSDEMAALYNDLWTGWAQFGDGPQMQFAEIAQPGPFGSWGVRASLNDVTPRSVLLDQLNGETPAWWEARGGTHFQHGVTLRGDGTDETLTGTDAEDYLIAGGGNDILLGHGGNDTLHGGSGTNDVAVYTGARADYTITYGLRGGIGGVTVTDTRSGAATDGTDWVVGVESLSFSDVQIDLMALFPALASTGPVPGYLPPRPTEGDDTLQGGHGADIISGLGGNDRLIGGYGHDELLGGDGDDRIEGGIGPDGINGGAGIDTATYETAGAGVSVNLYQQTGTRGNANGDQLFGIENVLGSRHADDLTGSAGDNHLAGARGHDTLIGYDGDDTLEGGIGRDTLDGSAGRDTAAYETAARGVVANLATGTGTAGNANGDTFISIENLLGSAHADLLTGSAGDNHIASGRGHDTLRGAAGDDTLEGGAGADEVNGGSGTDTAAFETAGAGVRLNLTAGTGTAGNANGDTYISIENVLGSAHADHITGSAGNNILRGGAGDDTLRGSAGDDTLFGGAGNDELNGGSGADAFVFASGDGDDRIQNFNHLRDTIEIRVAGVDFGDLMLLDVTGGAQIGYGSGTVLVEGVSVDVLTPDVFVFL